MIKQKSLYLVKILLRDADGAIFAAVPSREIQVAATDARQAIRKVAYAATMEGKPLAPLEFVNEVTNLGVIEIK